MLNRLEHGSRRAPLPALQDDTLADGRGRGVHSGGLPDVREVRDYWASE